MLDSCSYILDFRVSQLTPNWDAIDKDKASFVANTIEDGLKKLENDQTVFYVNTGILKGAIKKNLELGQNLRAFGETKTEYQSLVLNKNSPLVPLFKKATLELFEKGQYDYISKEWIGKDIEYFEGLTSDVMGPGQVFLVFVILTAMLACSLACLILECMHFHVIKKRLLPSGTSAQRMVEVEPSKLSSSRIPPMEIEASTN